MIRSAAVGLFACISFSALAQRSEPKEDLAALLQQVEQREVVGERAQEKVSADIIAQVQNAPLAEVRANLPTMFSMAEASDNDTRELALTALMNVGFTNQGSQPVAAVDGAVPDMASDLESTELLVPYIPKLLCLLSRGSPTDRALSYATVQEIAKLKPVPPQLMQGLLQLLASKQSTLPLATVEDQLKPGSPATGGALGPQLLWIVLPAGATYYRDPRSGITDGWDTPEVQEAVRAFLEREDQTPETLTASIRALALAEAQNPTVNASLVPLLDSQNADVQLALVQKLPQITLTADAFFVAKERVRALLDDPNATPDVRAAAARMLPCWSNDRHHGMCPALE